jgi:hypothetical protein
MHKFKLNYFPRGFNNTYQLIFPCTSPKTLSHFGRLTEHFPYMHVHFVSYLLSVFADAARGKRSSLNILENME